MDLRHTGCSPLISERTSILTVLPFPKSHIDRIFAGLKLTGFNLDILKCHQPMSTCNVTVRKHRCFNTDEGGGLRSKEQVNEEE